jgi:membrane-associated phospholipid phosphatase
LIFESLGRIRIGILAVGLFLLDLNGAIAGAQEISARAPQLVTLSPTSADDPDSTLTEPPGSEGSSSSRPTKPIDPGDLEVSWRKMPSRFLHDQKEMWLFPVRIAEGKHWIPTAAVLAGTTIFIKEDPPLERKVRQTDRFTDYNKVLKSSISGGLITVVPVGFYAISLIRKDSYGQGTGLLCGEAVLDDTILMIAMKAITRRARPSEFPPNGAYNDTFFATHNSLLGKGSSFPSGHAMMAFSVADVFAQRYRHHKWVPYVAYTLATAISFSRITTGAHFASDVFVGAATGFAIARFDVMRH